MGYRFITAFFSLFLFAQVNAYVNPTAEIELDMQGYDPTTYTREVDHEFTGHDLSLCMFTFKNQLEANPQTKELNCVYELEKPYGAQPGFVGFSTEALFADVLIDPFAFQPELAETNFIDGVTYQDVIDVVGTWQEIPADTPHPMILAGAEVTPYEVHFVIRKFTNEESMGFQANDLEIARVMLEHSLDKLNYKLPMSIIYRD